MPEPLPKAAGAGLEAVLRHEPGLQLGKRRIGLARGTGTKNLILGGELRLGAA